MPDVQAQDRVIALVRDMIFASKIRGTAEALDMPIHMLRDPQQLAGQPGRRLIVDLNLEDAVEAAAAWRRATGAEVIGFVSHVDADTIQQARVAGIEHIMARSQFVRLLPDLLR